MTQTAPESSGYDEIVSPVNPELSADANLIEVGREIAKIKKRGYRDRQIQKELADEIGEIKDMVARLTRSLLGDGEFGAEGTIRELGKRINELEKQNNLQFDRIDEIKGRLNKWAGAICVIAFSLTIIGNLLFSKIFS